MNDPVQILLDEACWKAGWEEAGHIQTLIPSNKAMKGHWRHGTGRFDYKAPSGNALIALINRKQHIQVGQYTVASYDGLIRTNPRPLASSYHLTNCMHTGASKRALNKPTHMPNPDTNKPRLMHTAFHLFQYRHACKTPRQNPSIINASQTHACICQYIRARMHFSSWAPHCLFFPLCGNWVAMGRCEVASLPQSSGRTRTVHVWWFEKKKRKPLLVHLRGFYLHPGMGFIFYLSLFSTCKRWGDRRGTQRETIRHLTTDSSSAGLEGNGS